MPDIDPGNGDKEWIKETSPNITKGLGARRKRLDLSLRGHEPLKRFRFGCLLSRHLGQGWGGPAPGHPLLPSKALQGHSLELAAVWIQFPALGQVPFAADGLFTLPFVEITSDLLLIVSKINTDRLADLPGAGRLCHRGLGAIASHLKQPVISSLERGS